MNNEYQRALRRFEQEVGKAGVEPEELALLIDAIAYPHVDAAAQRHLLDRMAELVGQRLAHAGPGLETAELLMDVFRHELGFEGKRDPHDEADNSYLSRVLERRTGLPILLALVCVSIGRRLGLEMDGLGFPGHFMARLRHGGEEWLLDAYHGSLVAVETAGDYLSRLFGQPVTLPAELFIPYTPAQWAQRILNNLRNVYLGSQRYEESARVLEFMQAIAPEEPALWRERALLHYHTREWEQTVYDLRRYFFLRSQFSLMWGTQEARAQQLQSASAQDKQLLALYEKISNQAARVN